MVNHDVTTAQGPGLMRRLRTEDEGSGLVLVVGSMMVLAMLALTVLAYTVKSQRFARYDQDFTATMTAAQSGIDDFISRLNRQDGYGLVPDCTNVAWKGPGVTGNTCGWTSTTAVGWAPVDASRTGPLDAFYHYSVDASEVHTKGTIALTVTGRENGVYRTVATSVGKGGSTDYVYYTDYESADPANVQAYVPSTVSSWSTTKKDACGLNGLTKAKYWHTGRNGQGCVEITFIGGDVIDGEVFTNDSIYGTAMSSTKPLFKKQVRTGQATCASAGSTSSSWESNCLRSGSVADFNGVKPLYATPLYLDDTSAAFSAFPGCHYFGSTRVEFKSNGTMTVWNRTTVNNGKAPIAIAGPTGVTPTCGDLVSLNSAAGATVSVPDEMVIDVATSTASMRQCYLNEIGGTAGRTLPLGTYASTTPATPTSAGLSYTLDTNMTETTKACARGNLYVEGTLKGRVTLSSAESIVVTGDLVLAGGMSGPDMLGLVATNSVEIFHPRMATVSSQLVNSGCSKNCAYKWSDPGTESEVSGWPTRFSDPTVSTVNPTTGIQIAGSIQTLQHSFLVQKYDVGGAAGTLMVNGSIAQRWRGIVGKGTNGYIKAYSYDTRLKYAAPPYFPRWAASQWSLRYSGEINTPAALRG